MSPLPPPTSAPAGWYPDPVTGRHRYFDGVRWHPATLTVGVAPREEHPHLPFSAALGALAVLVASLVAGKVVVDATVGQGWPLITYIVIAAALSYGPSILWLAHVRRRWGAGRLASVGWRFRWLDLAWGPITWIAAIAVELVLIAVVLGLDVPLSSNVESISEADADRAYLVATAVAAVVAAPIVEELVFRGLVLRGLLSRLRPAVAVTLQGVLFGVAHVDPARGAGNIGLAIVLSGVGVALGAAAYLTRRLGPAVIAHAIFNGVVVAILLSGALDDTDPGPFDGTVPVTGELQLAVVDEPDLTEPGRHQDDHRDVGAVDLDEGVDGDELEVLEAGARFGLEDGRRGSLECGRVALAGGVGVGGGLQRP